MKKFFALALIFCMLFGTTALADITNESASKQATTTVEVEIQANYTVTIPASIKIDPDTRTGSDVVTIAEHPCLSVGKSWLNVSVDTPANTNGAATFLKDVYGHRLYYRMYKDDSTQAIYKETLLLQVSGGAAAASVTLNFVIPDNVSDGIYKYAGQYTDTLTFIVEEK